LGSISSVRVFASFVNNRCGRSLVELDDLSLLLLERPNRWHDPTKHLKHKKSATRVRSTKGALDRG
jgi:hypothetical protein